MAKPTAKRRNAPHSKRERIDSAAQRRTRKTVKRKPTRPVRIKQRRPSTEQAVNAASKQARIIALPRAQSSTTIEAMMRETGWQAHSVRGFLAGVVRKKLGLDLTSTAAEGRRIYRIEQHRAVRTKPHNVTR